ncbi:MAG: glutamine--tRNA ligase, partial [Oscillospiraceae bacterium]|nr:glutamine--tRNA ligase [Oscillospiraceae bacterium]
PAIYRIVHSEHHRQGNKWCIYPLYDYAHPIQDALEGITHSLCSIEFENHRPLYEWVVDNIDFESKPKQREFARLNVTYTVMSKRYLRELVESGTVDGWDDPRMPTICGLRRRGYTPSSINAFVQKAGVAKAYSVVDIGLLEHCIRDELNMSAQRRMAVLDPIKVTLSNYPEDRTEYFKVSNNPNDEAAGERELPFTKELYIERGDFEIEPPPKYHRLSPGKEVRLMGAYLMTCEDYKCDGKGRVTELICRVDPETGGKNPPDGRKVKGTIHWVSARHCLEAELRMYDRLFTLENVGDIPEGESLGDYINPDSIKIYAKAKLEKSLADAGADERFQFVRNGYFIKDSRNAGVYNNIVTLKDTWVKVKK